MLEPKLQEEGIQIVSGSGGGCVGLCDGSVRFLPSDLLVIFNDALLGFAPVGTVHITIKYRLFTEVVDNTARAPAVICMSTTSSKLTTKLSNVVRF